MLGDVAQPRHVGQQLRLQLTLWQLRQARLHHRDRHPQFVRGIGEELVTRGIPLLHLVDRVVEGFHQRCDLGRHQLRIQTRTRLADIQLLGLLCGPTHATHRTVDHGRHHQQRDHDQRQEEPQADQAQHHQRAIQQPALRCPAHHHRDAPPILVADHHPRHVQIGRHQ